MKTILFSNIYYSSDRNRERDSVFNTLHSEFRMNALWPEYIGDWWIRIASDYENQSATIYTIDARYPDTFYSKSIDIWHDIVINDAGEVVKDTWFQQKIFSIDDMIRIVQTNFGGLFIMDERLNTILHVPRTPEMMEKNAVYGFAITESHIIYWMIDDSEIENYKRRIDEENEKILEPFKDLPFKDRNKLMRKQGITTKCGNVYTDSSYIPECKKSYFAL